MIRRTKVYEVKSENYQTEPCCKYLLSFFKNLQGTALVECGVGERGLGCKELRWLSAGWGKGGWVQGTALVECRVGKRGLGCKELRWLSAGWRKGGWGGRNCVG